MPSDSRGLFLIVGLLALAGFAIVVVNSEQANNQIVRPNQDDTPAPVVPYLPDLIGCMRSAKDACEDHAMQFTGRPRLRANAEPLYSAARRDFDGCISYIQAAMTRRFENRDVQGINQRLQQAQASMNRFLHWPDSRQAGEVPSAGPAVGAAGVDPLDCAEHLLTDWLRLIDQQDAAARDQLFKQLEACRLTPWNRLGK